MSAMVKVRVRERNEKGQRLPSTWDRPDFPALPNSDDMTSREKRFAQPQPEADFEVPEEAVLVLRAGGWLVEGGH